MWSELLSAVLEVYEIKHLKSNVNVFIFRMTQIMHFMMMYDTYVHMESN